MFARLFSKSKRSEICLKSSFGAWVALNGGLAGLEPHFLRDIGVETGLAARQRPAGGAHPLHPIR